MTQFVSNARSRLSRVKPSRKPRPAANHRPMLEPLELRRLFSVAIGSTLSNTFGTQAGGPTTVDLAGSFDDTTVVGPVVRFTTSLGNIDIELFDQTVLSTAQNFVNYVANNLYTNTVIHRSVPGFVIQGGGYASNEQHIVEGPPIANEYSAERPNVRGTIAMAKLPPEVPGGGPDSATSEWFINLADNTDTLGPAQNGGFTVFGQIINDTMTTVDAIAALPITDTNPSANNPFDELPVRNPVANGTAPTVNDFVFLSNAGVIPDTKFLTLSAVSDDPSIVSPTISNGILTLNYGSTRGTTRITVTATDSSGANASQTFTAGNGELTVEVGSGGVGQSVSFTEADGGKGSVSLAKGGSAFVRFQGDNLSVVGGRRASIAGAVTGIGGIDAIDTTTNSTLTISTKGGDGAIDVGGMSTDGPLKTLTAKATRFTGVMTIGGTVRSVSLGNLSNGDVTFGGSTADGISLALSLGSATDTSFLSGIPVKSIKATEFLATGNPKNFSAPAVTSVSTRGAFQQSLVTSAAIKSIKAGGSQKGSITATALGSLSALSLDGGTFTIGGGGKAVGKIASKTTITGTTVISAGDIGSVSAREVISGRLYAGVTLTDDQEIPPFLPTDISQFATPSRIASVKIATKSNQLSIAASRLGKLSLGELATDDAVAFGLSALEIDALSASTPTNDLGPGQKFSLKKLDAQSSFEAIVAARGINLGNFVVTLF